MDIASPHNEQRSRNSRIMKDTLAHIQGHPRIAISLDKMGINNEASDLFDIFINSGLLADK